MKNRFTIYVISALVLLSSCSDSFLDLSPESNFTEKNYYQTEGHFEEALVGVYEGLRAMVQKNGFLMSEMRSDNAHYVRNMADRGQRPAEEIADFTNDAVNTLTEVIYKDCYSAISRTNVILDRIEDKDFSEDFKKEIIGQTKLLRAYFYFELVKYFGPVSLSLSEVRNADETYIPRSSVEEVYKVIIEDVKDAIAKLDNPDTEKQDGRVTKGTAKMLYAYILMTKPNPDYPEAEKQLREILTMGYDLIPYADLFDNNHKNSKESIFEVQFQQGDNDQQSSFIYWMMPITGNGVAITGHIEGNVSEGGYIIPTQEMVDLYPANDKRLNESIRVALGLLDSSTGFMEIDSYCTVAELPAKIAEIEAAFVPEPNNSNSRPRTDYCYFVYKYCNPHAKQKKTDDNFPIYRYADTYLLLAECLVAQGKEGDAIWFVNEVRDRAGISPLPSVDAKAVADERRRELAFECKRWHDLVRTGQAVSVMTEYGKKMKAIHPYLEARTYNVTAQKLVYPIPYRELQINNQLVQNDGY